MSESAELTSAGEIRDRYDRLRRRLREAAEGAGRDPDAHRVVAVTKSLPIEVARAAVGAGLTRLGENRVQEALPKIEALPDAEWHLIGRLQSNKARRAAEAFAVIHSVDSLDLLRRLDASGAAPRLLLQVNVTGDPAKAGFDAEWFAAQAQNRGELATLLGELHRSPVVGLMTIGRLDGDPRPGFAQLRRLRDALEQSAAIGLPELSMGMSADADAAVAEGATLVRIGTALFGPRSAA